MRELTQKTTFHQPDSVFTGFERRYYGIFPFEKGNTRREGVLNLLTRSFIPMMIFTDAAFFTFSPLGESRFIGKGVRIKSPVSFHKYYLPMKHAR